MSSSPLPFWKLSALNFSERSSFCCLFFIWKVNPLKWSRWPPSSGEHVLVHIVFIRSFWWQNARLESFSKMSFFAALPAATLTQSLCSFAIVLLSTFCGSSGVTCSLSLPLYFGDNHTTFHCQLWKTFHLSLSFQATEKLIRRSWWQRSPHWENSKFSKNSAKEDTAAIPFKLSLSNP